MAFLSLESVSVEFPIFNMSSRSLKKQFIEMATGNIFRRNKNNRTLTVRALNDVSLRLHDGDKVGIIGPNGAGKSTLLRVLANIYEPTKGKLAYAGNISPLLNVMLGINPESTGYENIILRGLLLGLTRKQILAKIDEIAEFTELGDYLYVPICTYSSGMLMRLAFAVATSINPEILLMDEVIGAVDNHFLNKSRKRLDELIKQSSIVVLASHTDDLIRKLCNKAIFMHQGSMIYCGDIEEAFRLRNSYPVTGMG